MKRIVLIFGLISGAIMFVMMLGTLPFVDSTWLQDRSMIVGYTTIVLSSLLIFFGIRSYRENIGGGAISFGRAFAVGILIALIAAILYVTTWEILYFGVPGFADKFLTMCTEHARRSGASVEEIKAELALLNNPFTNAALAFLEPFPVGLLVTLISALILRKKPTAPSGESPAPIAA